MSTILWLEMVSAMKKQTMKFVILMVEIAVEIVSTKIAALILQGRFLKYIFIKFCEHLPTQLQEISYQLTLGLEHKTYLVDILLWQCTINCTHVVEETKILVTTSSITKFHFYPTVPIAIALVETLTIKYQMH